jgi:hypothetical protein
MMREMQILDLDWRSFQSADREGYSVSDLYWDSEISFVNRNPVFLADTTSISPGEIHNPRLSNTLQFHMQQRHTC